MSPKTDAKSLSDNPFVGTDDQPRWEFIDGLVVRQSKSAESQIKEFDIPIASDEEKVHGLSHAIGQLKQSSEKVFVSASIADDLMLHLTTECRVHWNEAKGKEMRQYTWWMDSIKNEMKLRISFEVLRLIVRDYGNAAIRAAAKLNSSPPLGPLLKLLAGWNIRRRADDAIFLAEQLSVLVAAQPIRRRKGAAIQNLINDESKGEWTSKVLPATALARAVRCNRKKVLEYFENTGIVRKPGGYKVKLNSLNAKDRLRVLAEIA